MPTEATLLAAVRTACRKLGDRGDFDDLLKEILAICVDAVGAEGGTIYLHDRIRRTLTFQHVIPALPAAALGERDIADDFGMAGEAFQTQSTVLRTCPPKTEAERNEWERASGITVSTMLATPLCMEDEPPLGVVQLLNKNGGPFDENDVAVIETIASVATLSFRNRRLVMESARASTLLGMGKVSHDIGNLASSLYATIGFAEMTSQQLNHLLATCELDEQSQALIDDGTRMFAEMRASVDRIVGYAHLISDMSMGRPLKANRQPGSLATTVRHGASFLETDARAKGVSLAYEIEEQAPELSFDELFLFRIVQNLVGNAIKASVEHETLTPRVVVRYRCEPHPTSFHVLEVTDTGPGMTPEIRERILQGEAASQWNRSAGTGWGMRIVKELAACHDATLDIESEPGRGSTFRLRIPA